MTESNAALIPTNAKPTRYAITLEPDLTAFTFKGSETIDIEVLSATSSITLNCIEIEIQSCAVTPRGGSAIAAQSISFDEEAETATFEFGTELAAGAAALDIEFTGELNDKLRGFYRSTYTDADGVERVMATTQMEATDARRAFPCWDEPALKATFALTLLVPSDLAAESNMPIEREVAARPGVKSVTFGETPIMSTYLLAFIIGDLTHIERVADNGTLIRVFTTRGRESQAEFALDTSARLLKYFNDYFGIPYPLPKLDHYAIPDFAAGAMENWGAITYRETALLVDPANTSAGTRQLVAGIIAHEMAHMWFGDLVTMAWWDDLWLNESFASWMGDKATDALFPDWEVWTQFVSSDTNRALSLDGLRNSHPIEQEVHNPAEIGELFDAISYSKGASVLRMLESFLGADTFRQGLNAYLTKHQYANAVRADLWNALGEVSGQPVAEIMDTWVMQTGYPVLDVGIERTEGNINLHMLQRRFLYDAVTGEADDDNTSWRLPVGVYTGEGKAKATTLMDGRTLAWDVEDAGASADAWTKLNPEQVGFYRVKYFTEDLRRLRAPISEKALSPQDRLGIQNDAFALSRAGLIPATDFLTIAEAYGNEDSAPVCADLSANLGGLDNLLHGEEFYAGFQAFSRGIFRDAARQVGWDAREGESHTDALLRSTLLNHMGSSDDDDTLREAAARFASYAQDAASVSPDIRGIVFGLAAKRGDRALYDQMWELRAAATLPEEKMRFMYGLTGFEQTALLGETLERSLGDEVRVQDSVSALTLVASNSRGRDLAWQFLKDNWAEYDRRYGEGGFAIMRIAGITAGFTTLEMRDDVERFFADNRAPGAERTVRQSLERIRLNHAWLERNRDELAEWFVG